MGLRSSPYCVWVQVDLVLGLLTRCVSNGITTRTALRTEPRMQRVGPLAFLVPEVLPLKSWP